MFHLKASICQWSKIGKLNSFPVAPHIRRKKTTRSVRLLQVQSLYYLLQLLIGDAQIPLSIGQVAVVELVHDQRQVDPVHPGMVAPGLAQAVGAVVAPQAYIAADGGDKQPHLLPRNGLRIVIRPGAEKQEVIEIRFNRRIGLAVQREGLADALVDDHLVALAAFLLFEPEAVAHLAALVDEVADAQVQQVGDPQRRINPHYKQQKIAVTALALEQVFDLRNLVGGADRLDEIHSV